jgi:hypothetical protein
MSIFDDMFDPDFMWDSEYKQRADIRSLQQQVLNAPEYGPQMRMQAARIDQLELLCRSLVELLVRKGMATSAELRVIMQQLDLEDGVEDGRVGKAVRSGAPRCAHCQRFVNPQRAACVYCGTPMVHAAPQPPKKPPRPDVTCVRCSATVPESETYFSSAGLVCESCFDPTET